MGVKLIYEFTKEGRGLIMSYEGIFKIKEITLEECDEMLDLWESSVRATHDFLIEEDIDSLKPLVRSGLLEMQYVICMKEDNGMIKGFMGIIRNKIEMLFVKDKFMGSGIGKLLITYAIDKLNARYVDVNEQNKKAVGFYTHLGFKEFSNSKVDSQGNPFPILHMKLGK